MSMGGRERISESTNQRDDESANRRAGEGESGRMANRGPLDKALVSNGYMLAMTPERFGWLTPSDSSRPHGELWEQFGAQGYL